MLTREKFALATFWIFNKPSSVDCLSFLLKNSDYLDVEVPKGVSSSNRLLTLASVHAPATNGKRSTKSRSERVFNLGLLRYDNLMVSSDQDGSPSHFNERGSDRVRPMVVDCRAEKVSCSVRFWPVAGKGAKDRRSRSLPQCWRAIRRNGIHNG